MLSLSASAIAGPARASSIVTSNDGLKHIKYVRSGPVGLQLPHLQLHSFGRRRPTQRTVLTVTRAEGQTQTITRESSTITVAPVQGKEKSPELDDGGTGFPPRDDGDGGGGGGGGGGWSGGFFFFGFLAILGLLKDKESEDTNYADPRRR